MARVEICIESDCIEKLKYSVQNAYDAGVPFIELCAGMSEEGLTPTQEQIEVARSCFGSRPGLMVMIRPRGGNFCYDEAELQSMMGQIRMAARAGADGVVLGCLSNRDSTVNVEQLNLLAELSRELDLKVTFHRAIDATPNSLQALLTIIDLGVDRVLTNGTAWGENNSAVAGIGRIVQMLEMAQDRISIVIGGGITSENVGVILDQIGEYRSNIVVHTYSAVREDYKTDAGKLAVFMQAVNQWV